MYETLTNNGDKLPTSTGFSRRIEPSTVGNFGRSGVVNDAFRLRSAREARGLTRGDATDKDRCRFCQQNHVPSYPQNWHDCRDVCVCVCVVNTYANICYVQIYILLILLYTYIYWIPLYTTTKVQINMCMSISSHSQFRKMNWHKAALYLLVEVHILFINNSYCWWCRNPAKTT